MASEPLGDRINRCLDQGDLRSAVPLMCRVLQHECARLGESHVETVRTKRALADALLGIGDDARAEGLLRDLVRHDVATHPPRHPRIIKSKRALASLLRRKWGAAVPDGVAPCPQPGLVEFNR